MGCHACMGEARFRATIFSLHSYAVDAWGTQH